MKLTRTATNGRRKQLAAAKSIAFNPHLNYLSFSDDDGYHYAGYVTTDEVKGLALKLIPAAIDGTFFTPGNRTSFELVDALAQSGKAKPSELAKHLAAGLSPGDKLALVSALLADLKVDAAKNQELSDYIASVEPRT